MDERFNLFDNSADDTSASPTQTPQPSESVENYQPAPEVPPPSNSGREPVAPDYHKQTGSKRALYITIAAAVVIAALAAYYFLVYHKPKLSPAASQSQASSSQAQNQPAASQITSTTKSYTSPNFNLSFTYPNDWTIVDQGGGIMTATSPTLQLKSANSQTASGKIVLTIRDHAQKLTEFNSGNATATRDSIKAAYTKPTQTQRANTYISFLQYATTTTTGGLDGVYITGDSGYKKGQAIPLVDVQKVDPIISILFDNASGKPMSIADSAWNDTNFSTPLMNTLQSFSIN